MFACDQLSEYHCSPENENFILALINQLDYNKYNNCYSFENDIIKRTAIIFSIACGHHDVALELIKMTKPIDSIIINYCYGKSREKALDLIKKTNETSEALEILEALKTSNLLMNNYYDESNFGAIDTYNETVLITMSNKIPKSEVGIYGQKIETIHKKNIIIKLIAIGLDFSISADDIKKTIDKFTKPPYSKIMYNSYSFGYILQCEYAYARRRHVIIKNDLFAHS
jgi:hypothetical protein